jgi:hypothetical protein
VLDGCPDPKRPKKKGAPIFELMMARLFTKALKREDTLPFFQTDAGVQ